MSFRKQINKKRFFQFAFSVVFLGFLNLAQAEEISVFPETYLTPKLSITQQGDRGQGTVLLDRKEGVGVLVFIYDKNSDELFYHEVTGLIAGEQKKGENLFEYNFFFDIPEYISSGEYNIIAEIIDEKNRRIAIGENKSYLSSSSNQPLGSLKKIFHREAGLDHLFIGGEFFSSSKETMYLRATFYKNNLHGEIKGVYSSAPFAVEKNSSQDIGFRIKTPSAAGNYLVLLQGVNRNLEPISSYRIFRWRKSGAFAQITSFKPSVEEFIRWKDSLSFQVDGVAASGGFVLEVRINSRNKEDLVHENTYNIPVKTSPDLTFSKKFDLKIPDWTETLTMQVRILHKETQYELEKKKYTWKVVPKPKPIISIPGNKKGESFNSLYLFGVGISVLFLLKVLVQGLRRFKKKKYLVLLLPLFFGATTFASASNYILQLAKPVGGYSVPHKSPTLYFNGTVQHKLWKTAPVEDPSIYSQSIEGILKHKESPQEYTFKIPANEITSFRPLPTDNWIGFKANHKFNQQLLLGTYDLTLKFIFIGPAKQVAQWEFKDFVHVKSKGKESICPYGESGCSVKLTCDPIQKESIINEEGTWVRAFKNIQDSKWYFGATPSAKASCVWGCNKGYKKASKPFTCEKLPEWEVGKWSICSKTCGGGVRKRNLTCRDSYGDLLPRARCSQLNQPISQESCNPGPCCQQSGYIFPGVLEKAPLAIGKDQYICESDAKREVCKSTVERSDICCSGLSRIEATTVRGCNPRQGGDCFFCQDNIKEGTACSDWTQVCL